MKKRLITALLCLCAALILLPLTAQAAQSPHDTIPASYDRVVDLTTLKNDLVIKDSKTYRIVGSNDPTWYCGHRIKIQGEKNAPHLYLDGVRIQVPTTGGEPAIELNDKASAYLYFVGKDSDLKGAESRAAIQKNRVEGFLRIQVQTGTTVTCTGGRGGAGIGGSQLIRKGSKGYNKDMLGHGAGLYFGSETKQAAWNGTINAVASYGGAGIGGGMNGGEGQNIHIYSGQIKAESRFSGAGIGGGFGGTGYHIYIHGGTVTALGGNGHGGAGIGSGGYENDPGSYVNAHDIYIDGGDVITQGGINGAGIGGGKHISAAYIRLTGGKVFTQGVDAAGIGGGYSADGKDIFVIDTELTANSVGLNTGEFQGTALGRGGWRKNFIHAAYGQWVWEEGTIKIGSYKNKKSVLKLTVQTGWALGADGDLRKVQYETDRLIPNEYGRIDFTRLTLPYMQNYGKAILSLSISYENTSCQHTEFEWADRDGCHVWVCKGCGARDPAAKQAENNGPHIAGDWDPAAHTQSCPVCGKRLATDTQAPVIAGLETENSTTGESIAFTVSDPAKSGEAASGVREVLLDGVPLPEGGYVIPADGTAHTVRAVDCAGNSAGLTVTVYKKHRVQVVDQNDEAKVYYDRLVDHNAALRIVFTLPADCRGASLTEGGEAFLLENGGFDVGTITADRTFRLSVSTENPFLIIYIDSTTYRGCAATDGSPNQYFNRKPRAFIGRADGAAAWFRVDKEAHTQEELEAMPDEWWRVYNDSVDPDSIYLGIFLFWEDTDDVYVYAKAKKDGLTSYASTARLVFDGEKPVAKDETGQALTDTIYWGGLQFTVEDKTPVTVTDNGRTLTPQNGVYSIAPDKAGAAAADDPVHTIIVTDAGRNKTQYTVRVLKNELAEISTLAEPLTYPNGTALADMLPAQIPVKTTRSLRESAEATVNADVVWNTAQIAYRQELKQAQSIIALGTVTLPAGVEPCEEAKRAVRLLLEVQEAARYAVTVQAQNGTISILNAQNAEAPAFYEDETVIFTAKADPGYILTGVSVNGAALTPENDRYSFAQPAQTAVITAVFAPITSWTLVPPEPLTGVANGTPLDELLGVLPPETRVKTEPAGELWVQIDWDSASAAYDPARKTEQTFTVTGTARLSSLLPEAQDADVQISVTVSEAEPGPDPTPGPEPEPGPGPAPQPPAGKPETEKPQPSFDDVKPDDWFHDDVEQIVKDGLMQGTGSGFEPRKNVSRAMVWMILARMEGVQTAPARPWYALARAWAMEAEITDGTRPDDAVTREELATLLYRYEKRRGGGFTGSWYFLLRFPDAASISAYADEAIHWCVMKGVLTGRTDGRLDPAGTAVRAELAAILRRYQALRKPG